MKRLLPLIYGFLGFVFIAGSAATFAGGSGDPKHDLYMFAPDSSSKVVDLDAGTSSAALLKDRWNANGSALGSIYVGASYTNDNCGTCTNWVGLYGRDDGCNFSGWKRKNGTSGSEAKTDKTITFKNNSESCVVGGGKDSGLATATDRPNSVSANVTVHLRDFSWNSSADTYLADSYSRVAQAVYSGGSYGQPTFTYTSTDTSVCTVNATTGVVTNKYKLGTCTINMTASQTPGASLTINNATRSVSFGVSAKYAYSYLPDSIVGDSYNVIMTVQTGANVDIPSQPTRNYSSDSPSVCTIDQFGAVTNVGVGYCKVNVTATGFGTQSSQWPVNALQREAAYTITQDASGNTLPAGTIFTTETPRICNVLEDGTLYAVDSGDCIIRAYHDVNDRTIYKTITWPITADKDLDGWPDGRDNCPNIANADQSDLPDADGVGDVCDEDDDNDGWVDEEDNCPAVVNDQTPSIIPGIGQACYTPGGDQDSDGFVDEDDFCPFVASAENLDMDGDGAGDVCDDNIDGDSLVNSEDNCPYVANDSQDDSNQDGIGDACERRYVALDGDDANDCTSWVNACATLQKGIDSAQAAGLRLVFVKAGVYKPASTVNLQAGISLVGGFAGTELKASDADASTNLTIISGDTSGDDAADADGIVSPVDTSKNGNNLARLLSASGQGIAKANKITLQGFILNAANNSSGNGGALVVDNSYVELLATKVLANAATSGGGAYVANAGVLDLTSTTLDGNKATTLGGAVYVTGAGSNLVIEKAVMTSNSASKGGAVAAANSAVLELLDTSVQVNTATNGAAIAVNSAAELTMTESALALNTASSTAGGILAEGTATLTVSDSNIESNTATTRGGAMVLANTGATQLMRNYFGGNTAADAGAIDVTAGTKAINNNTFYDNSASSATAGAIRVQGGTANLDYLTLVANSAVTNGGGLLNSGGTINLSKSLIAGNTATSGENVYGAIVDGDYNLVGFNDAGGMAGGAALSGTNSKVPTAAEAATLTDLVESAPGNTGGDGYYSDVKTVPLAGGGLARDAIAELDCGYDYDTRGELRPDKKSGLCDIGAYEFTILSCTEDAQRRYDQGELFVKYCDPALENFELGVGSIGQYFIWMLVVLGLYRYQRKQQFS